MLATEFAYFLEHRAELLAQYPGKHIVIKDGQVLASFDTETEGYTYVVNNGLLGTALLQLCSPDESSYVQYVRHGQANPLTIDPNTPRIAENSSLRQKNDDARAMLSKLESSPEATELRRKQTITVRDDMPSYSQGERVQAKLRQTEKNLAQLSQESRDELLALRSQTVTRNIVSTVGGSAFIGGSVAGIVGAGIGIVCGLMASYWLAKDQSTRQAGNSQRKR